MTVSTTPDLDEVFGKKEIPTIDEIKARVVPTQFPRLKPDPQQYADDFCRVMLELTEGKFRLGPKAHADISRGAKVTAYEIGFFDKGFLSWSMKKMWVEGVIIKTPESPLYLVPYYNKHQMDNMDTSQGRSKYLRGVD